MGNLKNFMGILKDTLKTLERGTLYDIVITLRNFWTSFQFWELQFRVDLKESSRNFKGPVENFWGGHFIVFFGNLKDLSENF